MPLFLNFCNIVEPFLYGFAVDIVASPQLWHDQSPCITQFRFLFNFCPSLQVFDCRVGRTPCLRGLCSCTFDADPWSPLFSGAALAWILFLYCPTQNKLSLEGRFVSALDRRLGLLLCSVFLWFGPIILLFIQSCLISTRHLPGSEAAALAAPTLSVGRCFSSLVQFLISFCLMRVGLLRLAAATNQSRLILACLLILRKCQLH